MSLFLRRLLPWKRARRMPPAKLGFSSASLEACPLRQLPGSGNPDGKCLLQPDPAAADGAAIPVYQAASTGAILLHKNPPHRV